MDRIPNPALDRLILNHLAELYGIYQKREGIHLSSLVYCITRSFFDNKSPILPTDEEVMLFALGYGLQDVLTPKQTESPVYEKDGITFRPDFIFPIDSRYVEIKTTRMSSNKEKLPETWTEYIKGGCYIRDTTEYELSVLYILGNYKPPFPQVKSEKLVFTDEELVANWNYIMSRKKIYEEALAANRAPTPFKHCKDFECQYCRYKMMCDVISMTQGGKK